MRGSTVQLNSLKACDIGKVSVGRRLFSRCGGWVALKLSCVETLLSL